MDSTKAGQRITELEWFIIFFWYHPTNWLHLSRLIVNGLTPSLMMKDWLHLFNIHSGFSCSLNHNHCSVHYHIGSFNVTNFLLCKQATITIKKRTTFLLFLWIVSGGERERGCIHITFYHINIYFKASPFHSLWLSLPRSPIYRGHLLLLAPSWVCRWVHSKPLGWWGWRWWGWLLYQDVSSLPPVVSSLRCVLLSDGSGTQPGLKRISMETWRPIYLIETVLQGHRHKECSTRITKMWYFVLRKW